MTTGVPSRLHFLREHPAHQITTTLARRAVLPACPPTRIPSIDIAKFMHEVLRHAVQEDEFVEFNLKLLLSQSCPEKTTTTTARNEKNSRRELVTPQT